MPVEELFPDTERQLLIVLVTKAYVSLRHDPDMRPQADELEGMLRRLSGTDTVLVAQRAYPSALSSAEKS